MVGAFIQSFSADGFSARFSSSFSCTATISCMDLYNLDSYAFDFGILFSTFIRCFISAFSRLAFVFASITRRCSWYSSLSFSCLMMSFSHLCFESPRTSKKNPAIIGVVKRAKKNHSTPLRPLFFAALAISKGNSRINSTISNTIKTSMTECPICSSGYPISSDIMFCYYLSVSVPQNRKQ